MPIEDPRFSAGGGPGFAFARWTGASKDPLLRQNQLSPARPIEHSRLTAGEGRGFIS